jgi:hypothetical protein
MKRAIIPLGFSIILLTACETPYEGGLLFGVKATQIDATTLRISSRGNALTQNATIQNYVLLKAAEETVARGYDLFQIVGGRDTSRSGSVSFGSATAYGTYNSATAFGTATSAPFVLPGQDVVVRMMKGEKGADAPPNLFVASEVLRYLGPQVGGRNYSVPTVAAERSGEIRITSVTAPARETSAPSPPSPRNATPSRVSDAATAKPTLRIRGGTVTRNESGPSAYLPDPYGAWIDWADPDGPAAKAGIRPSDIIRAFNGHRVETFEELEAYAAETVPGTRVRLGVFRNRQMITIDVDL